MILNLVGGDSLNFRIIGSTSEPSAPKQNDIWVNTGTPITGWVFSAVEPTPVAGLVWVRTVVSSLVAFNAVKNGALMVYPDSVYQYANGEWSEKVAKTYLNGEWTEWYNGELYRQGNEYASITGGWALSADYGTSTHGDSLTKYSDNMVFESSVAANQLAYGFVRANNMINLTDTKAIKLIVSNAQVNATDPLLLCVKTSDTAKMLNIAKSVKLTTVAEETTFTLDVEELVGSYYVGVTAPSDHGGSVAIKEVRME